MMNRHPCFYRVPPQELHGRNRMPEASQTRVIDIKRTSAAVWHEPDLIWKDTKIATLELNIRDLEDEIQTLKSNGLLHVDGRAEELHQMELYNNHSKFLKNKIDLLKQDVVKKECELMALQTKLDTLTNQNSDCKKHIEVLKESLSTKERRASILQTEVDVLHQRLDERESMLNKKIQQIQDLQDEKGTLSAEICDLKDMLDVKEKKINVMQKKVENLQEQLRDRDKQLESLGDRMTSLQADSSNTDTALITLEEALSQKVEEAEVCKTENKELKSKLCSLQERLLEREMVVQACAAPDVSGRSPQQQPESLQQGKEVMRLLKVVEELQQERQEQERKIHQLERTVQEQKAEQHVSPPQPAENSSSASGQVENLMVVLQESRREIDVMKQQLSSVQNSLSERDTEQKRIRTEHRTQHSHSRHLQPEARQATFNGRTGDVNVLEVPLVRISTPEDLSLREEEEEEEEVALTYGEMTNMPEGEDQHEDHSTARSHHREHRHTTTHLLEDDEEGIWA